MLVTRSSSPDDGMSLSRMLKKPKPLSTFIVTRSLFATGPLDCPLALVGLGVGRLGGPFVCNVVGNGLYSRVKNGVSSGNGVTADGLDVGLGGHVSVKMALQFPPRRTVLDYPNSPPLPINLPLTETW